MVRVVVNRDIRLKAQMFLFLEPNTNAQIVCFIGNVIGIYLCELVHSIVTASCAVSNRVSWNSIE